MAHGLRLSDGSIGGKGGNRHHPGGGFHRQTIFGFDSTLPVTMDLLIPHTKAVRQGAPGAFLVGDMPYMSYQVSPQEAIRNAGRFMAECGCDAVKLKGGREVIDTVKALIKATIPVAGHLGLTPQSIAMLGGFKAQGRDADTAMRIIEDARALEEAGACFLLEAIPPEVSKVITRNANVPIIGIGAGPHVDGQCLIVHDMLGMFEAFTPKFVKKYADIGERIVQAMEAFKQDLNQRNRVFSEAIHNYHGSRRKNPVSPKVSDVYIKRRSPRPTGRRPGSR